jgi:hypothetical protein
MNARLGTLNDSIGPATGAAAGDTGPSTLIGFLRYLRDKLVSGLVLGAGSALIGKFQRVNAAGVMAPAGTATDPTFSRTAGEATATPGTVALAASTANNLLAANANRIRATIVNPLTAPIFVRKATLAAAPATAAAGGHDFVVPAGDGTTPGQYELWPYEWAGGLNGICALAGNVGVSESV